MDEILTFANDQLMYAIKCVDSARNERPNYCSPLGIDNKGGYVMGNPYTWRSGFYPGLLWLMFYQTKDSFWLDNAIDQTICLETASTWSVHDLGFMFNNSYGKAYRITKEQKFFVVLKIAANTLIQRYNPNVGCIRSWGNNDDTSSFKVIIDNMMNLELLFEMTRITKDSIYYNIAVNHANKTIKNHFRDDGSSWHVVNYDWKTGEVIEKKTDQGYSDDSYWSRGQSWGLYGFVMSYRYTHNNDYLLQAKKIADFLMSLKYDNDLIPYWDMLSPDIPNTVRDASSASIMASALIELSYYCNGIEKERYLDYAVRIVSNLHSGYESKIGSNYGFLLMHSTGDFKRDDMVDVPIIYADYYYLESVLRLLHYENLRSFIEGS